MLGVAAALSNLIVLVESAHKAAVSPAPYHPADTPYLPRVDVSCSSISTSACEHLPVASISGAQGRGAASRSLLTLFEWTLDTRKRELLNSATQQLLGGAGSMSSRGFVVQLEQDPWFILPPLSTSYQFRGEYKRLFPPCTICLNPLKWRLRLFKWGLKQRNPAGFKVFTLIRNSRYKRPCLLISLVICTFHKFYCAFRKELQSLFFLYWHWLVLEKINELWNTHQAPLIWNDFCSWTRCNLPRTCRLANTH